MIPYKKKTSKSAIFVLIFLITSCSGILLNEIRDSRRDFDRRRIENVPQRRQNPDQHLSYRNFGQDMTEKDSVTDNLFDRRSFRTGTPFRDTKIGKNSNRLANDLRFTERHPSENYFQEGVKQEDNSYFFLRRFGNTRHTANSDRISRQTNELRELNIPSLQREDFRTQERNQIKDTTQNNRADFLRDLRNTGKTIDRRNTARNNSARRFTVEQRREDPFQSSEKQNKIGSLRRFSSDDYQKHISREIPRQRISDLRTNRNEYDSSRNEIRRRIDFSRRFALEDFQENSLNFYRKMSRNNENARNTIISRRRLAREELRRNPYFSREALRRRSVEIPSNRISYQSLLRKLPTIPDDRRNVNMEFPHSRILSLFDSTRQETKNDRIIRTEDRENRQREIRRTYFEKRQSRQQDENLERSSQERDSRNREENRELERRDNLQLRRDYSRVVNRQDIRKATSQRLPSRQETDSEISKGVRVRDNVPPIEYYEKIRQNYHLFRSTDNREERHQLKRDFLSDKDNKQTERFTIRLSQIRLPSKSLHRDILTEEFSRFAALPTSIDRIRASMPSRDELNAINNVDVTKKLGADIETNAGLNVWINTMKIILAAYLVGQMFVNSSPKNKFR